MTAELSPHVLDFIHYLLSEQDFFRAVNKYYSQHGGAKTYTIEDIYQYWLEHYEQKQEK